MADIPRIPSPQAFDRLLGEEFVVFFKHSPTCSVSWAAHRHVKRFLAENPSVPIHMLFVRQDYEFSQRLVKVTGIPHASPQILILRNGELVANTSHEGITASSLAEMIAAVDALRTPR